MNLLKVCDNVKYAGVELSLKIKVGGQMKFVFNNNRLKQISN